MFKHRHQSLAFLIFFSILLCSFLGSFLIGSYDLSLKDLLHILWGKISGLPNNWNEAAETVIFEVRMPRIFAAMGIGAALSIAGTSYQSMFRNPMVSPDLLGASAGAGFGAALGFLFNFNMPEIQIMAFIMGMAAVLTTYLICSFINPHRESTVALILTGIIVSTLFQALISIIKYTADPDSRLPDIIFWLMGGLANVTYSDLHFFLIMFCLGSVPLFMMRWRLNALMFGTEEALSLGVNAASLQMIVIICATILTASSVAIAGIIGWIGLIIPHLTRLIVGADNKTVLISSCLLGASFLLLADDAARSLISSEIPISIITSIIGAPFFILMLYNFKGRLL
ncbi:FecCD family ABC transporter permease [Pectinatus haikarae]|uniref:Iron complex transport system permease protein n=1 Tax=Pectinatus haikarae TaxID=349096 RepID=A0ABT9Y4H7_9FIRM|nr:iron ABC transporter permease [Pectinatus haikarae]MDQ0202735.1 iron complex transport system permease protein [Pectinatus haikarae]